MSHIGQTEKVNNLEISYSFSKLNRLEFDLHSLHLKLDNQFEPNLWDMLGRRIYIINR